MEKAISVIYMLFVIAYIICVLIQLIIAVLIKNENISSYLKFSSNTLIVLCTLLFVLSYLIAIPFGLTESAAFEKGLTNYKLWEFAIFAYIVMFFILFSYKIEHDICLKIESYLDENEEFTQEKFAPLCKDCDGGFSCENMHSEICHLNTHIYGK